MDEKKTTQRVKVQRTSLSEAIQFLQKAPEKEQDEYSLRQSILEMRDQIKGVLAKGYNYDEVAQMLAKTGIDIKGTTLRQYVTSSRRKKRTRRAATSIQDKEADDLTQDPQQNTKEEDSDLRNTNAPVANPSSTLKVERHPRRTTEDEFNNY